MDDEPRCTFAAGGDTCYCTGREGCQSPPADVCEECGDPACPGDWPDDDAGHGDDWAPLVVTEHAFADRGLL